MSALGTPAIAVAGVHKVYGGEAALAGVDLVVPPGTIHAVLGANGAGKSTLMRILAGTEVADDGEVRVHGQVLPARGAARAARHLGIAHIDQDRALVGELSITENHALLVGYPRRRGTIDRGAMRRRARAALADVGLDLDVDRLVMELSIADQTMVAIARALAVDARVLLLDEPTANLGAAEAQWLQARLRELRSRGVTCLLITHALQDALRVSDAVTVLRDGVDVTTRPASDLQEDELMELMMGRPVGRRGGAVAGRPAGAGPPRLSLAGVCHDRLGPLSLEVGPGEVVGVTGLVDAGHLALGDVLSGLVAAQAGRIEVDGSPFRPRSVRQARRAGVVNVPADRLADGLAPTLTSRENLFLDGRDVASRAGGIRARAERERARSLLEAVRVPRADPEATVSTLSGGNMQKVLIAKWLATAPRLLVLTEPTVGVDVGARADIYALVDAARADGMSVLLCSSDHEEVHELCDRVHVLRFGRVAAVVERGEATPGRLTALASGLSTA